MTYTAYDRPFMIEGEVNNKTIFFILDDMPTTMAFFSSTIIRKKKKIGFWRGYVMREHKWL